MIKNVRILLLLMLSVIALQSIPTHAEDKPQSAHDTILKELEQEEKALKSKYVSVSSLRKTHRNLTALSSKASECVAQSENNLAEKTAALDKLGERQKKESPELVKQRKQQENELAQAQTQLATCNAVVLRIQKALETADELLQRELAEQLLAEKDNILVVLGKYREVPVNWFTQIWKYSQDNGWIQNAPDRVLWKIAGLAFLGLLFGVAIRRFLGTSIQRVGWSDETGGRFAASVTGAFCHEAPYLITSLSLATTITYYTSQIEPTPVVTALAYSLAFFFITRFVIRFSLSPVSPGKLFLNIQQDTAEALARRLKVLTVIITLGYLLVDTLIGSSLPAYAMSLARTVVRIAFAVNLIWVLWLFGDLRGILKQPWLRYGLSFVLAFAVLADLTGYTNLSGWLLRSVFGSLFVIVVILVMARLSSELLQGLEYGHTSWQRKMRSMLGLTPDGHITGFFWFRLLVNFGWWFLLVLLLIVIWDLSASLVEEIKVLFTDGFLIGSLKIIPARIVFALVSLGLLVALSAWFQGQVRKHWVSKMPMDRGAREAMVTMIGYLGVAIAILITLGIAGIDYANLAIIAGALSLGIGFGLQNIVNNFVSGLILLFERPVKTGDWVVVGNTEGHVKRIRIRATQIQTFDRADVIVPNSELISGQVTNWMLHDPRGRVRVPVGVAYGSDTQKVKDIMLKAAHEHPDVISDESAPLPKVLFRQFGDSSLDFELRCHIKNVDERINVVSDLNFAIDAAFRENGIEIPFPQRDLHVKNWPGKDFSDTD